MKKERNKFGIILVMLAITLGIFTPGSGQAAESQGFFAHEAASLVIASEDRSQPATFWLKLVPAQSVVDRILAERREAGLDSGRFGELDYIVCQVSVLPDRFMIREQIYFDWSGEVIADWMRADWVGAEQPGEMVAAQAQFVLPGYFINRNTDFPRGLCGIPWGSSPDAVPGAVLDETLQEVLRIYHADVDVTALLGDVKQVKKAWLVFDRTQGLQRGVISFDGREYGKVLERLTNLYGNPRWAPGKILYWQLADDLVLELDVISAFGMLHGDLHVKNPHFEAYERQIFETK